MRISAVLQIRTVAASLSAIWSPLTRGNAASARRGGRSLARRFAFRQMESETFDSGPVVPCQCQRVFRQHSELASMHRERLSSLEKIAGDVTTVYLLRSSQYQFCNCGVLLHSCTSMIDLHRTNCSGLRRATWPRKRRRRRPQRRKPARRKRSRSPTLAETYQGACALPS